MMGFLVICVEMVKRNNSIVQLSWNSSVVNKTITNSWVLEGDTSSGVTDNLLTPGLLLLLHI